MKKSFGKILGENKNLIITGVICFIVGALVMIPFFPKRIAKLENGEEVIVEVEGHKFTADDLYKALKEDNGNEVLFKMVDITILKDKYPNEEENAKKFAEEQKEVVYTSYQQYMGYSQEEFLSANGFKSDEDFENELYNEYYYQKYYDDYTKESVTDKELKAFYKESVFGEKSIYLFSTVEDNASDLTAIKKKLKDNVSFNDIKDKYNNVNSYSYDAVNYTDGDTFTQTILNKIASTKKGSSSDVFTDDSYGSVLIYVVDEKDKPSSDSIKDEMREAIASNKQQSDEKLYYQAFIHLREEYKLNILDTELKDYYNETIKQYK